MHDVDKLFIIRHLGDEVVTERDKRNDRILDIMLGFLTSPLTMLEQFTPGGFEDVKRVSYEIAAAQNTNKPLSEVKKLSDDTVKDIAKQEQNLIFADTQLDYHKLNMVAAKLIGIFAVANISHATLAGKELHLYRKRTITGVPIDNLFSIDGHIIGDGTIIDPITGFYGERVSHVLALFLAASVDAVKDPVLNLMHINTTSVNLAVALGRLGFGVRQIGLFLSQPVIVEAIEEAELEGRSLKTIIKLKIDKLNIEDAEVALNFSTSLWEVTLQSERRIEEDYKELKLAEQLLDYSETLLHLTNYTRYNSISAAVGPRIVNNLIDLNKTKKLFNDTRLMMDEVNKKVTVGICKAFRDTQTDLANRIMTTDLFVALTPEFKSLLSDLQGMLGYRFNDSIALKFADTCSSLVVGRQLKEEVDDKLSYYILKFPIEFAKLRQQYITEFGENKFLSKLVLEVQDGKIPVLNLNTRGLSTEQVLDLKADFNEVLKNNPEFCINIVKYLFAKNGFGFSPKTFTKMVTNEIKLQIPGYTRSIDSFELNLYPALDVLFCINNEIYTGVYNNCTFEVTKDGNLDWVYVINAKGKKTRLGSGIYKISNKNVTEVILITPSNMFISWTELVHLGGNNDAFEYYKSLYNDENGLLITPILQNVEKVKIELPKAVVTKKAEPTEEEVLKEKAKLAALVLDKLCKTDEQLIKTAEATLDASKTPELYIPKIQEAVNAYTLIAGIDLSSISVGQLGLSFGSLFYLMNTKGIDASTLVKEIIDLSEKQNVCK